MLDEETQEEVRTRFFKITNIDLKNLEADEVRGLLSLLPVAIVYLHTEYDMSDVYREAAEMDRDTD